MAVELLDQGLEVLVAGGPALAGQGVPAGGGVLAGDGLDLDGRRGAGVAGAADLDLEGSRGRVDAVSRGEQVDSAGVEERPVLKPVEDRGSPGSAAAGAGARDGAVYVAVDMS